MTTELKKPKVKLSGQNGNIFNLMGIASAALKRAGQNEKGTEMTHKAMKTHSYDEALVVIMEYCEVS